MQSTVYPARMADVKDKQIFRTTAGWSKALADASVPNEDGKVTIRHQSIDGGVVFTTPFRANRPTTIKR